MDYYPDPCHQKSSRISYFKLLEIVGFLGLIYISVLIWLNNEHTIQEVQKIKGELNTQHKTDLPDFALYTTGGRIHRVINTENYDNGWTLLGLFNLCDGFHGPETILKATTAPGECWAFKGGSGRVIVKLLGHVRITAVTIQHIPVKWSPTANINSAPKEFKILGTNHPDGKQGKFLGQFEYDIKGDPIQTFELTGNIPTLFEFVDFQVLSNHGNEQFTCVYRFQVHGTMYD